MTDQERQQAVLLAQLNRKRELKRKYLHPEVREESAAPSIGELAMANLILAAIRNCTDLFGTISKLQLQQRGDFLSAGLNLLGQLAEAADCSPYELLIKDEEKQRRIVYRMIGKIADCDWKCAPAARDGSVSLELPGFDRVIGMSRGNGPDASLVLQREAEENGFVCRMMAGMTGKGKNDLLPSGAVLWEERSGLLCQLIEELLSRPRPEPEPKPERKPEQDPLLREAQTLADLCMVLEEGAKGLDIPALLKKKVGMLTELQKAERSRPEESNPDAAALRRNRLLLLGGAIRCLEAVCAGDKPAEAKTISEAAYLLQSAGEL